MNDIQRAAYVGSKPEQADIDDPNGNPKVENDLEKEKVLEDKKIDELENIFSQDKDDDFIKYLVNRIIPGHTLEEEVNDTSSTNDGRRL